MNIFQLLFFVKFVISTQDPPEMGTHCTGSSDLPRIISSVKKVLRNLFRIEISLFVSCSSNESTSLKFFKWEKQSPRGVL